MSRVLWLALAFALLVGASAVKSQVSTQPRTYSDWYDKQLREARPGATSPRRYTYDKYYYHNPAVSPYSNLMRPGVAGGTAYQTYVVPEQQRRQQTAQRQQQARRTTPSAPATGRTPSHYHNHWYGQWAHKR